MNYRHISILIVFFLALIIAKDGLRIVSFNTAYADGDSSEIKWPWFWGNPPDGVSSKRIRRNRTNGPREDGVRPVRVSGHQSCRQIMSHSQRQAPIYNDFMNYFHLCAGANCRPNQVYGMWGCRASGRSCHHTGEAVDIGGYKCGGSQVRFGTRTFDRFVSCMVTRGGFRKLYKCKDHWNHAHFSRGCAQRRI